MAALAPSKCYGCGREGRVLCADCVRIARLDYQQCYSCGTTTTDGAACEACAVGRDLRGVTVGAHYGQAVKKLVLDLKFHRLRSAAEAGASVLVAAMPALDIDVVTCVPIAPARYHERGYNQSELIARQVARQLALPYRSLLARRGAGHQLGLDRSGRLAQIRDEFYSISRLDGQRVLVVDDVVTTGATLEECAVMLTEAGASTVWGAAVARH